MALNSSGDKQWVLVMWSNLIHTITKPNPHYMPKHTHTQEHTNKINTNDALGVFWGRGG